MKGTARPGLPSRTLTPEVPSAMLTLPVPTCTFCGLPATLTPRTQHFHFRRRNIDVETASWACPSGCSDPRVVGEAFVWVDAVVDRWTNERATELWREKYGDPLPSSRPAHQDARERLIASWQARALPEPVGWPLAALLTERPDFRATGGMLIVDRDGKGVRIGEHHVRGITLVPNRAVPDLNDVQTVALLAVQVRGALNSMVVYACPDAHGAWTICDIEGATLTAPCGSEGAAWATLFVSLPVPAAAMQEALQAPPVREAAAALAALGGSAPGARRNKKSAWDRVRS